MSKIYTLPMIALLGACSIDGLFSNKDGGDSSSSSTVSGISSAGVGSSSSSVSGTTALDSLKKMAQMNLSPSEMQMVANLDGSCQYKYLNMSVGTDPNAPAVFFGDQGCFNSVVSGMTPAGLTPSCQSLWKEPFAIYQSNWQSIQKCEKSQGTDPSCATIMAPLMDKSTAFHNQCSVDAKFPWEKDHFQDSSGFQSPDQMKTYCADPLNSSKPECVQFAKCNPLFEQQGMLSQKVGNETMACGSTNGMCMDSVKNYYQPQFDAIFAQMQQNGCQMGTGDKCGQIQQEKATTLQMMGQEMSKCMDQMCKDNVNMRYQPKIQQFDQKLKDNQCVL